MDALTKELDEDLNTFLNEKLAKGKPTGYESVVNQTPEELAKVNMIQFVSLTITSTSICMTAASFLYNLCQLLNNNNEKYESIYINSH